MLAGCTPRAQAQPAAPAVTPVAPAATATPAPAAAPLANTDAPVTIAPPAAAAPYVGSVVAEQKVEISAEVQGRVEALYVDVGSVVYTGDLLLRQDSAALEARRAQAQAALETAAAQLDLLTLPADDSTLAAAQAAVSAAAARYQTIVDGPTDEDLRAAESQLRQAQAAVTRAQAAYNLVKDEANVGALPQSMALEQATLAVEGAQAQYDKLVKGATDDQIAAAWAALEQARDQLARLQAGAKQPQIDAAQAQVRAAETALYLAQLDLNKAEVRAPFDGVVAAVNTVVGAQAAPGARLLTLQGNTVKVEIAIEEARLADLYVGQPVEIRVNAWPDRVFPGQIAIIAPALDPTSRTVQVTVRPTGDAAATAALRPGMFAAITLLP